MQMLKNFWKDVYTAAWKFSADDASLLAASVAYSAALSFFPLLLILIAGLGFFFQFTDIGKDAQEQVVAVIGEQTSPVVAQEVQELLQQVRDRAGVNGPIGLVTLLVAAMLLFAQLETALDRIWNIPDTRPVGMLKKIARIALHRLRALGMILGLGLALTIIFVAGMVLEGVRTRTAHFLSLSDPFWWLVQTVVTVLLNSLVFATLFKTLPKSPVRWSNAWVGGLLTAVVWEVGRQVLAAFVIGGRYSSAYGVIGSFLAIMLWIYYAVSVVFLGAEYVHVAGTRRTAGTGSSLAKK